MTEFKVGDRVVRNPSEMAGTWSSVCEATKVKPAAPLVIRELKGADQIDVGIGVGWAASCFTMYFEVGDIVRRVSGTAGAEWYAAGGDTLDRFRVTAFYPVPAGWRVRITPTLQSRNWTGDLVPWRPEKFELVKAKQEKVMPFQVGDIVRCTDHTVLRENVKGRSWEAENYRANSDAFGAFRVVACSMTSVELDKLPGFRWPASAFQLRPKIEFAEGDRVRAALPHHPQWLAWCKSDGCSPAGIFEAINCTPTTIATRGDQGFWSSYLFDKVEAVDGEKEEIPVATLPAQKFSVGDFVVRRDPGDAAWVQWCIENKRQHHELFEIVDIQRDGRIGFKGAWGWHNPALFELAIRAAPTGDEPPTLAVGDFVTNVYPHPAWLTACEKVRLAPNSVFKIDGLEQVGSSTFVAIAGMPGVFARELFKLVFTPPVTGPEQEKEEMTLTNNTGAAVEPAATPSLVDTAKDQAISLGSAVTLGIKFAAVDQAGEVMLDLAKELAKDVPVLAPLLESPEGREMAKVLVALMAHSAATYAPNAIPKAGAIKTVAGLQLSVSTFKLVTPRLNELRKYLLALASIGEQFSEADLVPQALEAGDSNAVPISQGRSTVAR